MKVLFRTNGGCNIGSGHLCRCITLAKAIKTLEYNTNIIFIINEEAVNKLTNNCFDILISEHYDEKDITLIESLKPDIIIFDSYLADNKYLENLANIAKLAVFDDNDNIYNFSSVSIIINGNIFANTLYNPRRENTKYLLGPKYLVMKQEYWHMDKTDLYQADNYKTIMITTGSTDNNNLMIKFITCKKDLGIKLKVIIGHFYTEEEINKIKDLTFHKNIELVYKPASLKEHILTSDLVITAAGSTVYEILLLKKPLIIFTLADNQYKNSKSLEKYGILNLGWFEDIRWGTLPSSIANVYNNLTSYTQNIKHLYNMIDEQGAFRVAKLLLMEK